MAEDFRLCSFLFFLLLSKRKETNQRKEKDAHRLAALKLEKKLANSLGVSLGLIQSLLTAPLRQCSLTVLKLKCR